MDDVTRLNQSVSSTRGSQSPQKTKIVINVYDLLPPSGLSTLLWMFGSSLLHTGVVIKDREFAFGGHENPGLSGVYWTSPKIEPPGATFKCELLHGFAFLPDTEIDNVIKQVSDKFQGTSYNLLTKNCNHFTSHLCEQLTGKPPPTWLNRAASIGIALPCVVPKGWVEPPDHDTADGALVDAENEDDEEDERAAMLRTGTPRQGHRAIGENTEERPHKSTSKSRLAAINDTSGRGIPVSERAPTSKR